MKRGDPELSCFEDDVKIVRAQELDLGPVGFEVNDISFLIFDFVEVVEPPFLVS